jgi:hypothetical protein
MSTSMEDNDGRSITFKKPVGLDQWSKALGHFDKMFKILSGRTAMYKDFTDWLVQQDFVEVGLSKNELDEIMKNPKGAKAILKRAAK